jgi:hypothetical protein
MELLILPALVVANGLFAGRRIVKVNACQVSG